MATVSTCVCIYIYKYIYVRIYIYISIRKKDDSLAFCSSPRVWMHPDGGQFRGYVAFTRTRVGRTPFERRLRSHLHTEKSNGCNA